MQFDLSPVPLIQKRVPLVALQYVTAHQVPAGIAIQYAPDGPRQPIGIAWGAVSTNPATTDKRNASSLWFPMVACLIGLADNHTRDRRSTRRLVMPSYRETSSGLRHLEYRLLPSS